MNKNFFQLLDSIKDTEKIEELIGFLEEKGIIQKEIKEILNNVINTSDTIVREIMIPRTEMIAVEKNIKFDELIEIFDKYKYSRIPVYENNIDNILGFVSSKELLKYKLKNNFKISDILRDALFVPETKKILSLLKDFKEKKVHVAIVVDEFGGIAGLVTLIDIVEEIIGDFDDEFEIEEKEKIIKLEDNIYLIDSKYSIEELEEELNLKLPEGPFDTIGGFVIKEFGRMPEKDEKLTFEKYEITVNEVYEKGIKNIVLKIL